jgi:hypothetical protein
MDPNPHKLYQQMQEQQEYIEDRKENAVDLTSEGNGSVAALAKHIFSIPFSELDEKQSRIIPDVGDTCDLFCMLLELVLYGLDILSQQKATIFDLKEVNQTEVTIIKKYFQSLGFSINIKQEFLEEDESINTYRDRDDYFCQITEKPPAFLNSTDPWTLLNYRILNNRLYKAEDDAKLSQYKTFFINKSRNIYTIAFDFINI